MRNKFVLVLLKVFLIFAFLKGLEGLEGLRLASYTYQSYQGNIGPKVVFVKVPTVTRVVENSYLIKCQNQIRNDNLEV